MYLHKSRPFIQRGRGFGNLFSSIFRTVIPALKIFGAKAVNSPLIQSIGNDLKNSALENSKNFAADVIEGNNIKQSLTNRLGEFGNTLTTARKRIAGAIKTGLRDDKGNIHLAKTKARVPRKQPVKRVRRRPASTRYKIIPSKRFRKRSVFVEDTNGSNDDDDDDDDDGEDVYSDALEEQEA